MVRNTIDWPGDDFVTGDPESFAGLLPRDEWPVDGEARREVVVPKQRTTTQNMGVVAELGAAQVSNADEEAAES